MRNVDRVIAIQEISQKTETITQEVIDSIYEVKNLESITVTVSLINAAGDKVRSESHEIVGDNYRLLMGASPNFAPNKPENEYREVDLWHVIDLINA